ncbi:MAG TPA: DUF6089 family protein, partial [Chitinophagaceae bacterium]|nr:DUF6089 family protein [Chitinophagaceae bacterium]
FGGASAYCGELSSKFFPGGLTNGVIGVSFSYELGEQILLRNGINYTVLGGADRFSDNQNSKDRNLSFETSLLEFSVLGEYYLFNLYDRRYSPYAFVGLAVYHYNPYAYDLNVQRVYLKPLSTEGQGLAAYPDRKPYSLTQFAIPFGGGIKFAIGEKIRVGLELGMRKLFTDYLDDVSKNYIDPNDLFAAKGQQAVDLSYRGDEVGNPNYPSKLVQRGNENTKDYYYFAGIHLTFSFGNGGGGDSYSRFRDKRNRKNGCPSNPH